MLAASSLWIIISHIWITNPEHPLRRLVSSQALPYPALQLVSAYPLTRSDRSQETADHLSKPLVPNADDTDFADHRVSQQPFLDLDRGDILATYQEKTVSNEQLLDHSPLQQHTSDN